MTTTFAKPATIFTDRALSKAQTLVDAGSIVLADQPNVFFVPASDGVVHYRVTIDYDGPAATRAACSCLHGRHRTRSEQTLCYHATAALLHVLRAREVGCMSTLLAVQEA